MLNREKYAKELLDLICNNGSYLAVCDNKPVLCSNLDCEKCQLHGNISCQKRFVEWANSEYTIDWSKIPVDTPILVHNDDSFGDKTVYRRYFAKFEDGNVYAWNNGQTSWTAYGEPRPWNYAELANNSSSETFNENSK